jgi:hypothetical protein
MATGAVGPYNAAESQVTIKTITTFADVGAGNLCVMYGSSIAVHRQLEIRERIAQCIEALIEEGFVKPVAYRVATLAIDNGKAAVVLSEEAAIGTPIEGNVSVAYNVTFDNAPASTLNFKVTADSLNDVLLKLGLSAA